MSAMVELRMGAVAWAIRHRSISHPRSSNRTCPIKASGSALSLSRPAQASLTLRPAGLLSRLKRPLSRGSSPAGYPAEPLVSYQINRQLSGWNLPPLVIRAFGAHCQEATSHPLSSIGLLASIKSRSGHGVDDVSLKRVEPTHHECERYHIAQPSRPA